MANTSTASARKTEPLTLSVPVAAAMVGIGRSTLYELVQSGDVRCVRLGKRIVIPITVIEALLRGDPTDRV
jgi:excisionase family DNA binding protein